MVAQRFFGIAMASLLGVAGCSADDSGPVETGDESAAEAPTTSALANRLVEAMGGRAALEAIETLVREGGGTRTRVGQIAETGGDDPMGRIMDVTETIDLANGRAAFDYDVTVDNFMQHRTEVYTTFNGAPVGWATGPNRPNIVTSPNGLFSWATQNSPETLLRRNVISIALAAVETAPAGQTAEMRTFNGTPAYYGTAELASGEEVELYFDPDTGLLDGFVTLDTETMLGDVDAEYVLGDYRMVPGAGVTLPYSVTIEKDGQPYASIDYTAIEINPAGALEIFEIPADARDQAELAAAADGGWVPLTWNEVADGIYHAVGFSHHSMVVELPSFVAIVEGPYTEAQSLTLARRIEEEIGKPIAYVAPTHPHYDHTGGIRGLAAVGATVMVAAGHEAELRGIVESPHTNPPDELARRDSQGQEVGTVEVFEGMTAIEDGDRRLELYEVDSIPHVRPKVLAYVPDARVLFQSDLFFGAASPDATALYEAVESLGLEVDMIVGGHGGVLPWSSLEEAAARENGP